VGLSAPRMRRVALAKRRAKPDQQRARLKSIQRRAATRH